MKRNTFFCLIWMIGIISSCKKSETPVVSPGSIAIQLLSTGDTLVTAVPVTKDSIFVMGIKAISNQLSKKDIHVNFSVDTTKLTNYRSKYGNALLLPTQSYFFYRPDCSISAGANISDSAQLNIVRGSQLKPLTTYVLPVTISSVDGLSDGIAPGQVLYLVIKTGKSAIISKDGWKILNFSSEELGGAATALLDNDDQNTYWVSSISGTMPQFVAIDFGQNLTFSKVTYRAPSNDYKLGYSYPKSVKVELSLNGIDWTNKGVFTSDVIDAAQTINTGPSNARYLRFTVLTVQPLFSFNFVQLGGIGLAP